MKRRKRGVGIHEILQEVEKKRKVRKNIAYELIHSLLKIKQTIKQTSFTYFILTLNALFGR